MSQPHRANSNAIPLPTPLLAPVTRAVFDSSGSAIVRRIQVPGRHVRLTAEMDDAGKRLDQLLHQRLPEFSRSRIQEWIRSGRVLVNGNSARASHAVRGGETIDVEPA